MYEESLLYELLTLKDGYWIPVNNTATTSPKEAAQLVNFGLSLGMVFGITDFQITATDSNGTWPVFTYSKDYDKLPINSIDEL